MITVNTSSLFDRLKESGPFSAVLHFMYKIFLTDRANIFPKYRVRISLQGKILYSVGEINYYCLFFTWRDSNLWNGYAPTNCFEYMGVILSSIVLLL